MHDAVADAVKSGLAADMIREPALNGGNGGTVVIAGDGLISDSATLGVRNLQPRRRPDTLDLPVHIGREGIVGSRFEHRELDARRPGVDDENSPSHRLVRTWRALSHRI